MHRRGGDARRLEQLKRIADETGVALLAVNDALYHAKEQRDLQDVMTCIREGKKIEEAGRLLEANAERHLKAPGEMAELFREAADAIAETTRFADRIAFSLDQLKYNYPDEPVPKGKTPQQHLEDITWRGAARDGRRQTRSLLHRAAGKGRRCRRPLAMRAGPHEPQARTGH
ncbi:MAG: hypothetical protein HC863_01130 [Myxococcales bacterium]|nr:hypothetical protein [Myxococcales bacterium]